jgi:uncharacterized protein YbbC (DUF1343 family)
MIDSEGLLRHLAASGAARIGVVSQQASPTAGLVRERFGARLACLFSPEHGWFGLAAAGEKTGSDVHPFWGIPVHSLYGETRRPTPEMLAGVDRLVVDLQDLGVRCYTYLATLKLVLEAAAEAGVPVTVLDRPIPLGGVIDGPGVASGNDSFVAPLDVPLCHGMTPGECAVFIKGATAPAVDLTVIRQCAWTHADRAPWPNFMPPSPAIRSWDCAALYPVTVLTEAFPGVDCDRAGALAFRVVGFPGLDVLGVLADVRAPLAAYGVACRAVRYRPSGGPWTGQVLDGVMLALGDAAAYRPLAAGTGLFASLLARHAAHLRADARPDWLDKLGGSPVWREAVEGTPARRREILDAWAREADCFAATRRVNLY